MLCHPGINLVEDLVEDLGYLQLWSTPLDESNNLASKLQ